MSPEPKKASEAIPEERLGSLRGCLIGGDAEQLARERRLRRRALATSVILQCAGLTVLVLVPLFAKTERIAIKDYVPLPPYGHRGSPPRGTTKPTSARPTNPDSHFIFNSPTSKPHLPDGGPLSPVGVPEGAIGNQPSSPGCDSCIDIGGKENGPRPPQPPVETHAKPVLVHVGTIDPAMLIHRVEPIYPPLARQTHRGGRVELRAIIGTDGTIQSLQIVASDPLFDLSARDAVQQWRYRPTILNGQPVEIDTYITVIYTTPR
jgi:periplasmic protein TonB